MRILLACLLLSTCFTAAQSQPAAPSSPASMAAPSLPAGLAARRAQLLHRGVNASMWFAQARDYSPARLRRYTTADDIA
jgi:endoglucanase